MSLQKSIALLLTAFPITENDPDQELLVQVYEIALEGIPEPTAIYASMSYVQGKVERNTNAFRPSPAEVAEFARRRQANLNRTQQTIDNADRQHNQKLLAEPQGPTEEQRRAHVEAVLGRKVEHAKSVKPPAMTAADRKKPKPWMKSDVLRASMARIEAQLEADGVPLHPKEADFIHVHNPEDRNTNK